MAQQPIHLPVLEVARAAKAAFSAKRLSAQGPTPQCAYRDDSGRPCAIGAALTDEQALRLEDADLGDAGVGFLADKGLIATDDLSALRDLQSAHDKWASRSGQVSEGHFLSILDELIQRYEARTAAG